MYFKDYYLQLNPKEKIALADRLDTSVPYLSQIAHGHRQAGAKFLLTIELATYGSVKATGLRST